MNINRRNFLIFFKWVTYVAAFVLCAVLQTTPYFLAIGGVKPALVLPLCLAVAVYEGEFSGALFGAFGGLVWDMLSGRVVGFFALGVMLSCFAVALLAQLYLKENSTNFVLMTAGAALFITGYDFLFRYIMPGYSGALAYYCSVILPVIIFTAAVSPIALWLIKKLHFSFVLEE
ncbi:MAG: rod shape-determining protein MreD [Oscillospiraceae bacterium]